MPYMYILECSDKTFYTGSTWHLEQRVDEHNSGLGANYKTRSPSVAEETVQEKVPSTPLGDRRELSKLHP